MELSATSVLIFISLLLLINSCNSFTRNYFEIFNAKKSSNHKGSRKTLASVIRNVAEGQEGALDTFILRRVDKWACVKNCGACCKLGPLDSRPDLESYLTPDELKTYISLIGPDDWCVNFDKSTRMCKIYDTRPEFCKVDKVRYKKMFQIDEDDFNDFCAFCCREQIADVYGEDSNEMDKFEDVQEFLE